MSFYELFRHFADSYGLIVIFALFLLLCAWPFRPGSEQHIRKAANSIFEGQDNGE